jgi:hypothetical protein
MIRNVLGGGFTIGRGRAFELVLPAPPEKAPAAPAKGKP